MALTPLQEQYLKLRAEEKGYNQQKYLDFYRNKSEDVQVEPIEETDKRGILEKVRSGAKTVGSALIKAEKGLGETISSGIIPQLPSFKQAQESSQQAGNSLSAIATTIREKRAKGEDVTKLLEFYKRQSGDESAFNFEQINPASTKTNKQALGEVAGVGLDLLTAGTFGLASKGLKTGVLAKGLPSVATGITTAARKSGIESVKQIGIQAAKTGLPIGGAYGAADAAQDNGTVGEILQGAAIGAGVGLAAGGVLGGVASLSKPVSKSIDDLHKVANEFKSKVKVNPIFGSKVDDVAFKSAEDLNLLRSYEKEAMIKRGIDPTSKQFTTETAKPSDVLKSLTKQDRSDVLAKVDRPSASTSKSTSLLMETTDGNVVVDGGHALAGALKRDKPITVAKMKAEKIDGVGDELINEAKKYKSADEFVKAKLGEHSFVTKEPIIVYRGEGNGVGNSTLVNGQYFADSKKFASQFGDVSESVIPKGSKVFDFDKVKSGGSIIPDEMLTDNRALTRYMIENGFDYTRNTNTRGVEFVKLNKTLNELETLASNSKNLDDFKKSVMANYDKYRDEISRQSSGYTNADRSRLRSPINDIYNKIERNKLPKTKDKLTDVWNNAQKTSVGLPKNIKQSDYKEAIDRGLDPVLLTIIKKSKKSDIDAFQKMVRNAEEIVADPTKINKIHPLNVIGEQFVKRVPVVQKAKQDIGKKIGEAISAIPNSPVKVNKAYDNFIKNLSEAGVGVNKGGKLTFTDSEFLNDSSARKQFQQIYNNLKPNKNGLSEISSKKINSIRQRIGNDSNIGSRGAVPLSSNADRIIGNVRSELTEILEGLSPKLKDLNAEYSSLTEILRKTNALFGKDFKIGTSAINAKAGEVSRRLLGNAPAKIQSVIDEIEQAANKYGTKIESNTTAQVMFASYLDDLYGLVKRNSLGGRVQRAGEANIKEGVGVINDIQSGNALGLAGKVVVGAYNKIKGITPEKQQEILKKLIGL